MIDASRSPLRNPAVTTLTFDCYGTLVDWETGACNALRRIYGYSINAVFDDDLIDTFLATEARIIRNDLFPYRRVLEEAAREIAHIFDEESDPAREVAFANTVPTWPAFEEAKPALAALSRRYKLAIVSNIDDEVLQQTLAQFDVRFERIITSEQCNCYKPGIGIFEQALHQLGGDPNRIVHIAEGLCEAAPTRKLGMKCIWVRRTARSDDGSEARPDATVASLTEIVDHVRPDGP